LRYPPGGDVEQLGGVPHGIAVLDEVPDGSGGASYDVGLTAK